MWSCGPGAGEMLEVEGDGSALHAIKNLCLSGLSNSLRAALGGCHKSAHPALGTGDDNQVGLKLFFTVVFFASRNHCGTSALLLLMGGSWNE